MRVLFAGMGCAVFLVLGCSGDDSPTGTWVGESEPSTALGFWSNGPHRIEVVVEYADDVGGLTGRVTFGEGTLPPATDPEVGYPEEIQSNPSRALSLVEGFAYTLTERDSTVTRDDFEVVFNMQVFEPWETWCSIQTPIMNDAERWSCLPRVVASFDPGGHCTLGEDETFALT